MQKLFAALLILAGGSTWADDQQLLGRRAALLIGNSAYEGANLPEAGAELDRVERTLGEFGFRVSRRENLRSDEQKKAVEDFVSAVPTNGVALIYFRGYGANLDRGGEVLHLLRPVEQKIPNEGEYRKYALEVGEIFERFDEQSGSRLNFFVHDIAAENPLKPDDDRIRPGLGKIEAGSGWVVVSGSSNLRDELTKLGEAPAFPLIDELREGGGAGEEWINSIGMPFHWCPPGEFRMGAEEDSGDRAAVDVKLTKGFWMAEHEVTQLIYNLVMRKTVAPEEGFVGKNLPFWGLTERKNVDEFCKKLNELERKAGSLPRGWEYACPTEAEWEYACRAGSTAAFCFGDSVSDLGKFGNFADRALLESNPDTHWADARSDDGFGAMLAPVGSFRANAWGLRDMHGNVAELVADHLGQQLPGGVDPLFQLEKNGQPVIRGGAWCSEAGYCESSFRNTISSRKKWNYIGFRVVIRQVK